MATCRRSKSRCITGIEKITVERAISSSDPDRALEAGRERLVVCTAGAGQLTIAGSGAWTADNAMRLEAAVDDARPNEAPKLEIDMGDVGEMDTFGAWILERLRRGDGRPRQVSLVRLPERFRDLVEDVRQTNRKPALAAQDPPIQRLHPAPRATFSFKSS